MRVSRAVFAAVLVLASAIPARAQDTGGLAGLRPKCRRHSIQAG